MRESLIEYRNYRKGNNDEDILEQIEEMDRHEKYRFVVGIWEKEMDEISLKNMYRMYYRGDLPEEPFYVEQIADIQRTIDAYDYTVGLIDNDVISKSNICNTYNYFRDVTNKEEYDSFGDKNGLDRSSLEQCTRLINEIENFGDLDIFYLDILDYLNCEKTTLLLVHLALLRLGHPPTDITPGSEDEGDIEDLAMTNLKRRLEVYTGENKRITQF